MGEAGDFKCLTRVKLGPRPSKTGLFFRIKREPPLLSLLDSLATALRYLYLEDFRQAARPETYWFFTTLM